jgi:ADP-heptose:LPS heptosyltransferase
MGDVAMTVPVLKALTDTYPGLRISLLTRGFFKPIFSPLGEITVISADLKGQHKGLRGLWRLYRELQPKGFDAVADLHNVLRSNVLKQYFRLGGTPVVQIDKGRKEKRALTALKNKEFKALPSTHMRYASVFEQLGYPLKPEALRALDRQPLPEAILQLVGPDHKKWLGIAPFAAYPGKQYPMQLMKQVVEALDKGGRFKIMLFGGRERERELLEEMAAGCTNCLNMAGKISFGDELSLISNLDLMLSMDSGNAHLAANYGIPVVTLWGLTHPFAGFYPFGQDPGNALLSDRDNFPGIPTSVYGNKMPRGYEHVMESIAPQTVVDKVYATLGMEP